MKSAFIPDWVLAHAERSPRSAALATPDLRLSYGELSERVRALAGQLAEAGVRPAERVLVALPNSPNSVVAGLAVHALGACLVEVNRGWRAEDLRTIVQQSGVRHAFVFGRDARTWGQVAHSHPLLFWVAHSSGLTAELRGALGGAVAARVSEDGQLDPMPGSIAFPRRPAPPLDSPALILYTSGSTGKPRGVVQTWRNLDANTRSIASYLGLTAADRAMLTLPLSYCYGRSVLQTHLFAGGSVFLDHRSMYPRMVLDAIASEGCTGFAGVPLTFELIRRLVDVPSLGPLPLRYLTQAGGAMSLETTGWVRRVFHPARLFVMYGQTEATARLSYLPPERAEEKEGSIGIAIPGMELKVVDDSGVEVGVGTVGHLVARGESVTLGYLDEPEDTAAILRDGWLWTGDLARRDADGFFFHVGRAKEVLKIGGHRVSPVEIEQAIARHPEVAEAAVVGVKEELGGEAAAAFVVRREGSPVSEKDLRRFCSESLPVFKVPATITFVDALPRNEAGKLLRAELAARHVRAVTRKEGEGP
jgi:acyl-CoA synthetase (AMP-forming)/AMP-acid ligase II